MKCSKCNGRHHVSICNGDQRRLPEPSNTTRGANSNTTVQPASQTVQNIPSNPVVTTASLYCVDVSTPVLLQTARASVFKVNNPNDTREVRVIFDCGSQRSYITNELKNYLMLDPVCTETLLIKTFGAENRGRQVCDVVDLEVALQAGGSMRMSFLAVPSICEPISGQAFTYAIDTYKELESLKFSDYSQGDGDVNVDILVGLDQYWNLVTGEVVHCLNGPTAVYTRLGWVLSGPVQGSPPGTSSVNLVTTHSLRVDAYQQQMESELDDQLKMFWDLESLGVRHDEPSVYDEFQRGIVYKHPRYEVSLPLRKLDNKDVETEKLDDHYLKFKNYATIGHPYVHNYSI